MRISRVKAAVVGLCGIAAIGVTVGLASTAGAASGQPHLSSSTASVPVVVNCAMHAQTRPGTYILACGDGNGYVNKLQWASWGSSAAFATGSYVFNTCTPNCAAGHYVSFPVLAALWRTEPWSGHGGQRYFSRLTIILTGSTTYKAAGKTFHVSATQTFPLSSLGGA
ncbi:MAG: hypothetical protein ACRDPY_02225 [Streptosporangiaceae bacterium]